jgi:hypothetical protein
MQKRLIPCALAALFVHVHALADDPVIQRVLVEGARASQLGLADSANAGSVSQKELEMRTIYRPGELLEAAPGLIASQHSGEGKANQFYLRGFNLDHGTDLATFVDDMPVNQRSHAHGQGWTDLNFLMPELTARLDYRKGPYSARDGDFASAGSAAVTYANRLVRNRGDRQRRPERLWRARRWRHPRTFTAAPSPMRWKRCTTTARSRAATTTASRTACCATAAATPTMAGA